MTKLLLLATAASLVALGAHAQTSPPTTSTAPAATSPAKEAPPLAGANSFTEAQARSRIEDLGFTDVTGLGKDPAGVWRGKATKNGSVQDVAIDFRGNIVIGEK